VILDDASTDESAAMVRRWAARDNRIRLIQSKTPLGPAGSADRAVREAKAPICARMDADDISHPRRLRAELDVLEAHPGVSLVGTLWEGIDREGRAVRPRDRWRLMHGSVFAPFPHGSIMFRRDWFLGLGGYRTACEYWEDFDFYLRMEERGPIMVISEALYRYRFHAAAVTAAREPKHLAAVDLMYRCADRASAGQDYASLLEQGTDGHRRVDPRALRSYGSPRLWAGEKTAILDQVRGLVMRRPTVGSVHAIVLAVWGQISPKSLRALLAGFIRTRDWVAGRRVPDGVVLRWTPRPARPTDEVSSSGSSSTTSRSGSTIGSPTREPRSQEKGSRQAASWASRSAGGAERPASWCSSGTVSPVSSLKTSSSSSSSSPRRSRSPSRTPSHIGPSSAAPRRTR